MKRLLHSAAAALLLTLVAATAASAQTTAGFADVNGARIYYTSTGRGVPLVLIHGYPLNGDLFVRQRDPLSSLFQVITVDLRGFGRSIAPDTRGSIDIYAADTLAVMDVLGISQAVIGGHSMGGMTTVNMYRLAPQRFLGMILIDTTLAPPPIVEQNMWRGFAQQSAAQGGASLLPILLPEFLTGETRQAQPALVQATSALILQASINGLVGGATALAERPDLRPVLPTIAVPTLIIVGKEDSLTSVEVHVMIDQAVPVSQLAIIPLASHGAILEKADEANAVILAAARAIGLR